MFVLFFHELAQHVRNMKSLCLDRWRELYPVLSFHPANHSNTSVLKSERVCLSFPFFFSLAFFLSLFHFFFYTTCIFSQIRNKHTHLAFHSLLLFFSFKCLFFHPGCAFRPNIKKNTKTKHPCTLLNPHPSLSTTWPGVSVTHWTCATGKPQKNGEEISAISSLDITCFDSENS